MSGYRVSVMGPPQLVLGDPLATAELSSGETLGDSAKLRESLLPVALSRANRRLLGILAAGAGSASRSREIIAENLWPESGAKQSRSRLSSALWRLKRAMGEPFAHQIIVENCGCIGLAIRQGVVVDILELQQAVQRIRQHDVSTWQPGDVAAIEAMVQKRRGEFYEGVDGDWVVQVRRDCAVIYESALEVLMRYHRHYGHSNRSIAAAEGLVRHDPYREDIHAVLVELYAQKGQRNRPIAQYNECREILDQELGVAPGVELRSSLQSALDASPHSADGDVLDMIKNIDFAIDELARQVGAVRNLLAVRR